MHWRFIKRLLREAATVPRGFRPADRAVDGDAEPAGRTAGSENRTERDSALDFACAKRVAVWEGQQLSSTCVMLTGPANTPADPSRGCRPMDLGSPAASRGGGTLGQTVPSRVLPCMRALAHG